MVRSGLEVDNDQRRRHTRTRRRYGVECSRPRGAGGDLGNIPADLHVVRIPRAWCRPPQPFDDLRAYLLRLAAVRHLADRNADDSTSLTH